MRVFNRHYECVLSCGVQLYIRVKSFSEARTYMWDLSQRVHVEWGAKMGVRTAKKLDQIGSIKFNVIGTIFTTSVQSRSRINALDSSL